MSTEHAPTPVEDLRKPKGTQSGNQPVHVTDWCGHHGLYMSLMPFDYRNYDPLEACRSIKKTLDSMNDYAQTLTAKDCGISNLAGAKTINPLLRLYGVTKMRETSKGQRYNNPQYEHYDACIDPIKEYDERVAFYDTWKDTPTVESEWFAKHFGISSTRLNNWVRASEFINRQPQRDRNNKRYARTVYTVAQWTDYTQLELRELLPGTADQIEQYIHRYVRNSEWQPPERPTDKPWFRSD